VKIALLALLGFGLLGTYGALMVPTLHGYGYDGYRGWSNTSSFWYSSSVQTFHTRSVRGGTRGGGMHPGK
jgi:hypothetical protein